MVGIGPYILYTSTFTLLLPYRYIDNLIYSTLLSRELLELRCSLDSWVCSSDGMLTAVSIELSGSEPNANRATIRVGASPYVIRVSKHEYDCSSDC